MAAITDYDEFKEKLEKANERTFNLSINGGSGGPLFNSPWLGDTPAATAPTTSVACDNTTSGAQFRQFLDATTADKYLAQSVVHASSTAPGAAFLYDRLVHSGGLSGTNNTPQTTNLPTAALTRYTNGEGVMIGIEIFASIGSTATTLTASYTTTGPTAGRTTKPIVFGGSGNNSIGSLRMLPLQDGDKAVLSVESVTLAASTLTAGNFGVVLFKPLQFYAPLGLLNIQNAIPKFNSLLGCGGNIPLIEDAPCLNYYVTSQGIINGTARFIEA
jgi:hypothetical protein